MQKIILWIWLILVLVGNIKVTAQTTKTGNNNRKWYIGSSFLMLGNFIPDDPNPPKYIQINAGYSITNRDIIHIRFKKSQYAWPIGIPFGPDFDAPGLNYPGSARILAPQIGYQRFWWKGLYSSVYMLNAFEKYMNKDKIKIGNGFTLYTDFYVGYQFNFFGGWFFFEPAIGISYWPIRTGVPDSFKSVEKNWPTYFIQPGLDFGIKF